MAACAGSWQRAADRFDGALSFSVACLEDDPPPFEAPPCVSLVPMARADAFRDGIPSKGAMLFRVLQKTMSRQDRFLFTDCDIVFPDDFSPQSIDPARPYQVASRIDLGREDTAAYMADGTLPRVVPVVNPSKYGMGWFQLVEFKAFVQAVRPKDWERPGFDVIDWTLNRDLEETHGSSLVRCSPFLHLWHGEPGSTWKGTSEDL